MRVLVVEDDVTLARTIGRMLAAEGFDPTVVHDIDAAIAAIADAGFDALVLDFHLGNATAAVLLDRLDRGNLPAIVIMSGKITVAETVAVMKLGVGDVIQKPFDPGDLFRRLRRQIAIAEAPRTVPIPITRAEAKKSRMRLGMFDIHGMLAEGSSARVYRGQHQVTGKPAAIKILDPQFAARPDVVERLLSELQVSRRVTHPGLVHVLGAERTKDDLPYLVLELIDGQTLSTILHQRTQLDLALARSIVHQLADAVAALHAAGIVHADLKPDNVLVLADTRADGHPAVKLIDYGVAHFIDRGGHETLVWGTPEYLAPEQWAGQPATASDVYALGCIAFELVTGAPPFTGTLDDVALMHFERTPPPVSASRPDAAALDVVVARMLAKQAAARASMADVAAALAAIA